MYYVAVSKEDIDTIRLDLLLELVKKVLNAWNIRWHHKRINRRFGDIGLFSGNGFVIDIPGFDSMLVLSRDSGRANIVSLLLGAIGLWDGRVRMDENGQTRRGLLAIDAIGRRSTRLRLGRLALFSGYGLDRGYDAFTLRIRRMRRMMVDIEKKNKTK